MFISEGRERIKRRGNECFHGLLVVGRGGMVLKYDGRFRLGMRRKWVVTQWNRLPKEAVDAPSLQAFKARLDVALGSLVWWLATVPIVVLFKPGHSMVL